MKNLRKIAVIGSGPVGVVIATKLVQSLSNESRIVLIDAAKDNLPSNVRSKFQANAVEKRRFPTDSSKKLSDMNLQDRTFNLIGGFSNYWGATWKAPTKYGSTFMEAYCELESLLMSIQGKFENTLFSTVIKDGSTFCNCMSSLPTESIHETNSFLQRSSLLLNRLVIDSCDLYKDESLYITWNSKTAVEYLRGFSNFSFETNILVDKFSENLDGVILQTSQGAMEFDLVVFACGPIETSKILLRSLPEISKVSLLDTQMSYSLIIRWPQKKRENKFGLSHLVSEIKYDDLYPIELHTQYYAHLYNNRELIIKRLPRIVRVPATILLKIFDPFIVVAINYISSEVSGNVVIQRNTSDSNSIVLSQNASKIYRKQFKRVYRVLSRRLRRIGFLTNSYLVFHQAPGKSFHCGAIDSRFDYPNGKVTGCSRTYISGAASLPAIHPGPITTAAMSHGVIVANQIISGD